MKMSSIAPAQLRDQVERPAGRAHPGTSDRTPRRPGPTAEAALTLREQLLDPLANRVQRHPRLAVAHLAERELQLALPAEVADADRSSSSSASRWAAIAVRASLSSAMASIARR